MPVDGPIVVYKLNPDEPDFAWGSFRTAEQQEDQWEEWLEERNEPPDLERPEQGLDQLWPT